jgi:pyruvate/2-oxoglutarate dehydrogenase complex dihydrolipoamide dehydrogenase (E3) component
MSGFMKALVEAQSDRLLSFTMLGTEAGEVMAMVQRRCWQACPMWACGAILTHPTMAEGLVFLFANIPPRVVS